MQAPHSAPSVTSRDASPESCTTGLFFSCPWKPVEGGGMVQLVPKYPPKDSDFQVPEKIEKERACNLLCVMPACLSSPCEHGGQCLEERTGFRCECKPSFYGDRCEEQGATRCASANCPSSAFCHNYRPEKYGFYCFCGRSSCKGGMFCDEQMRTTKDDSPYYVNVDVDAGDVYDIRPTLTRNRRGDTCWSLSTVSVWRIKSPVGTNLSVDILYFNGPPYGDQVQSTLFAVFDGPSKPKALIDGIEQHWDSFSPLEAIQVLADAANLTILFAEGSDRKYAYIAPGPGDDYTPLLYAGSGNSLMQLDGTSELGIIPRSVVSRNNLVWLVISQFGTDHAEVGFWAKVSVN